MNKKEIIILVVVFISVFLLSTVFSYILFSGNISTKTKTSDVVKLENYTLKYGKYKGYETEYNDKTEKAEKKDVFITLTAEEINGEKYEVKGNKLYVNGFDKYEVISNNKFILLVGEGAEFSYEGK